MFNRIPDELKARPQWVNWRYKAVPGKKDTKEPLNPRTGGGAMSNEPSTWGTFEMACQNFFNGLCDGIGFMLCEDDPYTFIDFDDPWERMPDGTPKHNDPETIFKRQQAIFAETKSYAERSPSGTGIHIICKGSLLSGRKRSAVEVYSSVRFMTMTGDIFRDAPIVDEQPLLNILYAEMGKCMQMEFYDGNAPQREDDQIIINRALAASNGDKFEPLLRGDWGGAYPSQSEADLAFINIIAFYTQNREQIKRIFKASPLGYRNKQTTIRGVSYLDHMINRSFDRMLPPIDLDGLKNQLEEALAKQAQQSQEKQRLRAAPLPSSPIATDIPIPPPPMKADPLHQPQETALYSVPPGLVGELAQFIYAAAPRAIPEIALAGALGLMSGICGRAFNVSATGLNQYILLLAHTGRGKEAINGGISRLMQAVAKTVPAALEFIGPEEISSSQALNKQLERTKSFVSVVGEFGSVLKQLSHPNANEHKIGFRKQLLNLYNKSGAGSTLGGSAFADTAKNTKSLNSPSYSFIGESTQETFYNVLDDLIVNDGLLPRMTIIEYNGIRPPRNKNFRHAKPDFRLVEKLAQLCAHSLMLNAANRAVDVQFTADAEAIADQFDVETDERINPGPDGIEKPQVIVNLWTRAHVKAMKLAATIAVGCNIYDPIIDAEMMRWAIRICKADAKAMALKFERGEVGMHTKETKQTTELKRVVREYVMRPWSELSKYGGTMVMHSERVIPMGYLSKRLQTVGPFKNDRLGATNAIKKCITNLVETGDLVEVTPQEKAKRSLGTGKSYFIGSLVAFGLLLG